MFHPTIMEEVAAEQRSDRLREAEMARLLKKTHFGNSGHETCYLRTIRNFVSALRLNRRERITANKVGLLAHVR